MAAVPDLLPLEAKVLAMLVQAANAGSAAPTNKELCARFRLHSLSTPATVIGKLEQLGHIRVERFSGGREITIVASGLRTAYAGKRTRHPRHGQHAPRRAQECVRARVAPDPADFAPRAPMLRVDRDPCPRCAVRGDIGCAHRPAREPYLA